MKTENNIPIEQRLYNMENELKQIKQMLQEGLGRKENDPPETGHDIINVNEAMALLKMNRHQLYAKCDSKDIPSFRVGKQYKFKRSELVEWETAQKETEKTNVDDFVTSYLQKNKIRG